MNTKDLKDLIAEVLTELDWNAVAMDTADAETEFERDADWWTKRSKDEKEVLKLSVKLAGMPNAKKLKFDDILRIAAAKLGKNVGGWPDRHKAWKGDVKFYPKDALNWVCTWSKNGLDGAFGNKIIKPSGGCPDHWGGKEITGGGAGGEKWSKWLKRLSREEQRVLTTLKSKVLNREIQVGSDISDSLQEVADELGISTSKLPFLRKPDVIKAYLDENLPLNESKKRGFGEGEPPPEEIYKKREVVQEADLEATGAAEDAGEMATAFGDASGKESKARGELAAKQAEVAKMQGAVADAISSEKSAHQKIAKAKELEGKATAKAGDVAKRREELASAHDSLGKEMQKLADLSDKAGQESQGASEEAAKAAEERAAATEKLQGAIEDMGSEGENLSKAGEETASAAEEFGGELPNLGGALATDQETAQDSAEEEAEQRKADQEAQTADAEAANDERKASADAVQQQEEEPEPEEEEEESSAPKATFEGMLKSMIRKEHKRLAERKWGDKKARPQAPPEQLKKAGLTADDLRDMVLKTVARGEEDRDMQMIKLLQDMLKSLHSIEYHSTPAKGAQSKHAQTAAGAWMGESKNREQILNAASTISKMRRAGLMSEADDYESFFRWAMSPDLTLQEIKNEADAQIADVEAVLKRLKDATSGTQSLRARLKAAIEKKLSAAPDIAVPEPAEDSARASAKAQLAQLKKQMAEVPGHHN